MIQTTHPQFTAFTGQQRLVTGLLAEVALAVMKASRKAAAGPIVIFDDATGRPIDLDLRGTERDIVARLPQPASNPEITADDGAAPEPRAPDAIRHSRFCQRLTATAAADLIR